MTFRQLWDAYHEKKRFEGELAALQMSCLIHVMTGQKIEPADLNPYATRKPEPAKSPAQLELESITAWKQLDQFFTGK